MTFHYFLRSTISRLTSPPCTVPSVPMCGQRNESQQNRKRVSLHAIVLESSPSPKHNNPSSLHRSCPICPCHCREQAVRFIKKQVFKNLWARGYRLLNTFLTPSRRSDNRRIHDSRISLQFGGVPWPVGILMWPWWRECFAGHLSEYEIQNPMQGLQTQWRLQAVREVRMAQTSGLLFHPNIMLRPIARNLEPVPPKL